MTLRRALAVSRAADVEPLRLVVLGAALVVLKVGDQSVDDLILLAGQQDGFHAVGVGAAADVAAFAVEGSSKALVGEVML